MVLRDLLLLLTTSWGSKSCDVVDEMSRRKTTKNSRRKLTDFFDVSKVVAIFNSFTTSDNRARLLFVSQTFNSDFQSCIALVLRSQWLFKCAWLILDICAQIILWTFWGFLVFLRKLLLNFWQLRENKIRVALMAKMILYRMNHFGW
jgi:hypothetical protein